MLVLAFELLEPQTTLLQKFDAPNLQEHVDLEFFQYKSKEFQKELSQEVIHRNALTAVCELITL